ncbi:MAG: alkaline phytoceramidase [Rhodospirillaceae bacterium]|nr:MAG: alkaline phytoceramidase [Rhodospirillaceae bacterium]
MTDVQKTGFVIGLSVLIVGLVFALVPATAQPSAYHLFSDGREWLGVANFGDVASNLVFVIAGLWGLSKLHIVKGAPIYIPLLVFFWGVVLVGPGSAYYHLAPDNLTLFWDRVPMTIAFMGLFAAVITERINAKMGVRMILPLLICLGLASVLYWRTSEMMGVGDLRAYALVQFLPMVLIPLVMVLFVNSSAKIGWRALLGLFVFYGLAKVSESYDHEVFKLFSGLVSGHTLKHIFAGLGPVALVMNLKQ